MCLIILIRAWDLSVAQRHSYGTASMKSSSVGSLIHGHIGSSAHILTRPYEPHIFDNTHIISLVGNYSISPTLEIGGKWQYSSGTSGTHVSEILLIQDPITRGMQPIFSDIQGEDEIPLVLLPSYHRLDLRVSKTWHRKGWQIGGFLEILNVYNRRNTIKYYNPAGDNVQEVPQLPIIPYIGLTIGF